MKIDIETVERVAHLARLEFDEAGKIKMMEEMNKILEFCETLNEVNTDNVEPLVYISDTINAFREDIPVQMVTKAEALQNAPQKNSDYFKVPKVLDRE